MLAGTLVPHRGKAAITALFLSRETAIQGGRVQHWRDTTGRLLGGAVSLNLALVLPILSRVDPTTAPMRTSAQKDFWTTPPWSYFGICWLLLVTCMGLDAIGVPEPIPFLPLAGGGIVLAIGGVRALQNHEGWQDRMAAQAWPRVEQWQRLCARIWSAGWVVLGLGFVAIAVWAAVR